MRDRVDALGVAEPELQRSGEDQIDVEPARASRTPSAPSDQVGTTAQMYFYDWEPNILDEDCKTNPESVNGGQQAISGLYNAVKRASKCEPEIDGNNTTDAACFYAFDKKSHEPLNDGVPEENRAGPARGPRRREQADRRRPRSSRSPRASSSCATRTAASPTSRRARSTTGGSSTTTRCLGGSDIKNPEQNFENGTGGPPIVTMEFTRQGPQGVRRDDARDRPARRRQRAAQRRPAGPDRRLAPLRDPARQRADLDAVHQLPREPGRDRRLRQGAQISGGFTIKTAQDLARLLKIGALPLRLELISRSQVSATLGQQALDQGLIAGLAGFAIVALFLLDLLPRARRDRGRSRSCIYALYFFALIKLIPITLTLPGIAGLILTIGVAADANIVIFERVKEEIRHGRSISAGIAQGYKKGFATIVDANIVTLLVAFILFILATAGVKGFAFVLGIGTMVSLFTAVLATQAILLTMRGSRLLRQPVGARRGRRSASRSRSTSWARRSGSSRCPA